MFLNPHPHVPRALTPRPSSHLTYLFLPTLLLHQLDVADHTFSPQVTTHLPSSEEAFASCQEEAACRLEDVFQGATYSSFAGAAVVCHVFNQIMQHVHRSRPDDRRGDYEYGRWWNRHRELDNLLSSAFMFLPERFRLPTHVRDPVAVHTNLNLHASLICLHNSAYEVAREHDLPAHIRHTTMTRLSTTAQEVVNIIKLTSHSSVGFVSAPPFPSTSHPSPRLHFFDLPRMPPIHTIHVC